MKVIFTGGGSGGHYYPIIAIAEKLNELAIQEKILDLKLFYISDTPYDERALDDNNIKFIELKTGKFKPEYAGKLNFYLAVLDRGVERFLRIVTPKKHEDYIINLWETNVVNIA